MNLKLALVDCKKVQKSGISIGSKVAQLFSDLYLSKIDKCLEVNLG